MVQEDLSYIYVVYGVLKEIELELLDPNAWALDFLFSHLFSNFLDFIEVLFVP